MSCPHCKYEKVYSSNVTDDGKTGDVKRWFIDTDDGFRGFQIIYCPNCGRCLDKDAEMRRST